jgi:hypothetical protein
MHTHQFGNLIHDNDKSDTRLKSNNDRLRDETGHNAESKKRRSQENATDQKCQRCGRGDQQGVIGPGCDRM